MKYSFPVGGLLYLCVSQSWLFFETSSSTKIVLRTERVGGFLMVFNCHKVSELLLLTVSATCSVISISEIQNLLKFPDRYFRLLCFNTNVILEWDWC